MAKIVPFFSIRSDVEVEKQKRPIVGAFTVNSDEATTQMSLVFGTHQT